MFYTGQNVCAFYPEFPHVKIVCAFYSEFPHGKTVYACSTLDRTCVLFTPNFHMSKLSVHVLHWTERVCFLHLFSTCQNVCAFYPEFPHVNIVCACSTLDTTSVLFTLNFHMSILSVHVLH